MRREQPDLFGPVPDATEAREHLTVLPTSVVDLTPQRSRESSHNTDSSRSEFSPFPEEVARLCYELYLRDAMSVFDPFAGWGERGYYAKAYQTHYTGFDTSPVAIEWARENYGISNTLADSLVQDIPAIDGLITCPPYWNLEKYAGNGIDTAQSWDGFVARLQSIFTRCVEAAPGGATFCVMVGEWRKDGVYYDLEYQTRKIFADLGVPIFDQVVISRKATTKIKVMVPQAVRLGYTVRLHESLLVFRK
jgi:hypothetical protein